MATIDIGKIKPVFKGTYDNSTAYVLDDIVYYNGSSYVAKTSTTGNLPTDATKWNVLASGIGGIYDSTLSIGSAGQILQVNSGATALEFGSISSEAGKFPFHAYQNTNSSAVPNMSNTEWVVPAEHYDPNNKFDTSTGRYTPGETGVYFFSGGITMNDINGAGDMLYMKFRVNGATSPEWGHVRQGGATNSAYRHVNTTAVIPITNASDYVSIWFYQSAGGNRYIQGDHSHFAGFKIA